MKYGWSYWISLILVLALVFCFFAWIVGGALNCINDDPDRLAAFQSIMSQDETYDLVWAVVFFTLACSGVAYGFALLLVIFSIGCFYPVADWLVNKILVFVENRKRKVSD